MQQASDDYDDGLTIYRFLRTMALNSSGSAMINRPPPSFVGLKKKINKCQATKNHALQCCTVHVENTFLVEVLCGTDVVLWTYYDHCFLYCYRSSTTIKLFFYSVRSYSHQLVLTETSSRSCWPRLVCTSAIQTVIIIIDENIVLRCTDDGMLQCVM